MPESLSCAVKWWRVPQSAEVVGLFVCLLEEEGVVVGCNVTPVQRLEVCAHHRLRPVF